MDEAWYHDKMLTRTPAVLTQRFLTHRVLVSTVGIDATDANHSALLHLMEWLCKLRRFER